MYTKQKWPEYSVKCKSLTMTRAGFNCSGCHHLRLVTTLWQFLRGASWENAGYLKKIQMANAVPRNWHTKSVLDAWRRLLLGRLYVIKSNIKESFTLQELWVHPSPPGGCWVIIKLPCVLMATTSHEDPVRKAACRCEINFNSLLSQVLSWESWPKWDLNCFLLVNLYHP